MVFKAGLFTKFPVKVKRSIFFNKTNNSILENKEKKTEFLFNKNIRPFDLDMSVVNKAVCIFFISLFLEAVVDIGECCKEGRSRGRGSSRSRFANLLEQVALEETIKSLLHGRVVEQR